MQHSPESTRAALLLTNRLVPLDAEPMTAREFWELVQRVDPGDLVHRDAAAIAETARLGPADAARVRTLLDAATALGYEEERLRDGGVSLLSALDERFPAGLRERLGTACPPFLLVAGPIEWLPRPGLAIVGSRDAGDEALAVARAAAQLAVQHEWPVLSGLARGVDQAAMAAALDAGGVVVGVPAEGILQASRNREIRRRVHAGELCIASPYAPDAPFRAGNAMGRNKIVYALSRLALVVASDEDAGGTWAGATEALDRRYAAVAVWAGDRAEDGNHALIRRGATPVTELEQLLTIETTPDPPPLQETLF